MFTYYKMENKKYLNAIFDVNKYSFNGYNDVFLPERTINCCDDDIKILLKTNAFNYYIKWLEKILKEQSNIITSNHNYITKEQLNIESDCFILDESNYLYYYQFYESDEYTEYILLLNSTGNFIATGHNGGHLFIETDKFSFCISDGTGDLFSINELNNINLLEKSLKIIDYSIRNYLVNPDY